MTTHELHARHAAEPLARLAAQISGWASELGFQSLGICGTDRHEYVGPHFIPTTRPHRLTGKVAPLSAKRFIDLRAIARGFDLPKLSPYSGRWAGYAIEKGKLTADVRYRIDGDRLAAENRLVINQLTFGDKVDSPDATSLPVRLAVSLLKDRNGNIDLDIPISGTVSDPQFSVGGLLWRAIGNLIVRVVSAPFAFLASRVHPVVPSKSSNLESFSSPMCRTDWSRSKNRSRYRAPVPIQLNRLLPT